MISIKDVLEHTEKDLNSINYYERYMALGSIEKAIEQSRKDTLMALFFKPEIVEEIIKALNKTIIDIKGETK